MKSHSVLAFRADLRKTIKQVLSSFFPSMFKMNNLDFIILLMEGYDVNNWPPRAEIGWKTTRF